jgi:hypothetical protein
LRRAPRQCRALVSVFDRHVFSDLVLVAPRIYALFELQFRRQSSVDLALIIKDRIIKDQIIKDQRSLRSFMSLKKDQTFFRKSKN